MPCLFQHQFNESIYTSSRLYIIHTNKNLA